MIMKQHQKALFVTLIQKEGITYPTPEEALAELKKDGYTRVALASLDVVTLWAPSKQS